MAGFPFKLPAGAGKQRGRIVGRGRGSGLGKTCGRGHKGQKSRSGGSVRPGFEGGQMPLYRRLPKRGFSNARFAVNSESVSLADLERCYVNGDAVNLAGLVKRGLVSRTAKRVKILASGEVTIALTIDGALLSAGAREKIVNAGGKIEQVSGGAG